MKKYLVLVSYDLNTEGQDYESVKKTLLKFDPMAINILKSVWILETELSVDFIQKELEKVMDKNDDLLVAIITNDIAHNIDNEQGKQLSKLIRLRHADYGLSLDL